jgi:DNA-binding response OmpR family regulator
MAPEARRSSPNGGQARRLCALVVEADPDYAAVIDALLDRSDLETLHADGVDDAIGLLASHHVHLVVFGSDGDEASAGTARLHDATPASLIVLAQSLADAGPLYAAGADHVLPRPFVPGHLTGAIAAALRARDPDTVLQMASAVRVGDVLFDAERREVRWDDGFRVRFSAREWELLAVLLAHANRFFTAEELRDAAWGDASLGTDQVRGYVYRLRRKLEGRSLPCRLTTSRGLGYCLRLDAAPRPTTRA